MCIRLSRKRAEAVSAFSLGFVQGFIVSGPQEEARNKGGACSLPSLNQQVQRVPAAAKKKRSP